MSEQSEAIMSTASSSAVKRSGPLDGARQLACAWVGLWGVASDGLGNFYGRCVARGEQMLNVQLPAARPDVQSQEPDAVISQPSTAVSRRSRPVSVINAFVVVKPSRIDVNYDRELPTKEEFDALIERIEVLSREVDALVDRRKQQQ